MAGFSRTTGSEHSGRGFDRQTTPTPSRESQENATILNIADYFHQRLNTQTEKIQPSTQIPEGFIPDEFGNLLPASLHFYQQQQALSSFH